MKRFILLSAMFATASVQATSGANLGASLTTGPASNPYSISSAFHNPAMASLAVKPGEKWRLSYLPSVSVVTEYGQVDGFIDDLEELADLLDDASSSVSDAGDILERFNNEVLPNVGEEGYMRIAVSASAPLAPLYFYSDTLKGTIGLDLSVSLIGGISVLDDDLAFNDQNGTFLTATAIYLKAGFEKTLAASYSRNVYTNNHGTLYAGGKLKVINLDLSKQLIPIVELADDDIVDLIRDEYESNQVSTTSVGLDFGVVWDASRYRVGFTVENINSPEFAFSEIGGDCTLLAEKTSERAICNTANYFIEEKGRIKGKEVHVKNASMRIDGIFKLTERWQLSSAYDLIDYNDVIGYQQQWLHAAISYHSDHAFMPSLRVGYQKNLVGTKTESATFGLTLFKIISADFEIGLDDVIIEGNSVPKRMGFSLSVQESF